MDTTTEQSNQPTAMPASAQEPQFQTPAEGITTSTSSARPKVTMRKLVLDAIRQGKSAKGSSMTDIKKFVSSKGDMDLPSLKLFLKNAVDSGTLTKEDGKYKVKEMAKRKKSGAKKSPVKRKRKTGTPKKMPRKQSVGQKTTRKPAARPKTTRKRSQSKKKGRPVKA